MNFIIGTIIFLILCLGINSFLNDISSSSKEKKRKKEDEELKQRLHDEDKYDNDYRKRHS
ncbi:hypothetical protein [Bacteroides nordii]|jgi:hypothetical protein|uniref:hypothetical protein n=1 Tax=Bacteroides nordii TaxID=291645 RepID=UPI001898B515|nr:hypothetical protein [Bacteroides nordii]